MLMVSSSVWMLDWILGNTSNLWPAVPLYSEFVVSSSGLQHWFINSSTTGDESKHSSVSAGVELFDTRWEFHSGFAGVGVVGDNGAIKIVKKGGDMKENGDFVQYFVILTTCNHQKLWRSYLGHRIFPPKSKR